MEIKGRAPRPSLRSVEERNELVRENIRLVYWAVKRFFRGNRASLKKYYTEDDAVSDAFLGLIRASELFDPSRNVKFSAYAARWIFQKVSYGVKQVTRTINVTKKHPPMNKFPLVDEVAIDPATKERPDIADICDNVQSAVEKIHGRYKEIVRMRLDGLTLGEIGQKMGVSKERVRQIELRARAALVPYLLPMKKWVG
jgi:RNA polymerase primary sigma factor